MLQRPQVLDGEHWRELVECAIVLTITLTLVFGFNIFLLQSFTECLDLLLQRVFSHHQRELQASLAFMLGSCQQVEDNTTTETNNGSTFAIDVLYMVDILGCFHTLLFHPAFNALAESWSVNKTTIRTQTCYSLLNLGFVISRTFSKLRHLCER